MSTNLTRVELSAVSTEFIRVKVSATEAGVTVNPTSYAVSFAIIPSKSGDPTDGDFVSGSWETAGSTYYARINIGPAGAITLSPGTYQVWWRLGTGVETPTKKVPGELYIF